MIWKGNYDDLKNLHNISRQHPTINLDFVISKELVSFLDTKVFIYKDQNIQTTVYHKETDCQSYLHSNSEHPLCHYKIIPFSQALGLKLMCSTVLYLRMNLLNLYKNL